MKTLNEIVDKVLKLPIRSQEDMDAELKELGVEELSYYWFCY